MSMFDGGPAFPVPVSGAEGMSLRDWFAGRALAGLAANTEFWKDYAVDQWAKVAYGISDDMLNERYRIAKQIAETEA